MQNYSFEVNDLVKYNQGDGKWDRKGSGKILMQQSYLSGPYYLIQDNNGDKVQVSESHIEKL